MDDRIKEFLNHMLGIKTDYSLWKQVGKLTSNEMLLRRIQERKAEKMARDWKILDSKIKLLKAQSDTESKIWWKSLHDAHSLPEASYHIMEDGRIMVDPKSMPKKTMG